MKSIIRYSLLLVFLIMAQFVFAQQEVTVTDSTEDGTIRFAAVHNQTKTAQAENPKAFLKRVLKAGSGTEFYLYKIVTDELGMVHEKYQQTFNGIKVEFSEFIVHKDKLGNIVSINGDFAKIPESFNTTPKLGFLEALTKSDLTKRIGNFNILDLPEEKSIETPITIRENTYEIVIVKGYDNYYHLAYKSNLVGESIIDSFYGYSDCESGELIFRQNLIYHTNSPGTAATKYSDNQTIMSDSYSGGFRLREVLRGGTLTSIQTLNFNRLPATTYTEIDTGIANAIDFSDNDNNWTAAEHDNDNQDNAALDAHWGAERTFDYFRTVHERNSYDGNDGLIRSYVHVRTRNWEGNIIDMDNAFWLESRQAMFYGDGLFLDPLVSIDICAHELGHAVCNSSIGNGTGLIYSKESGALNESLSDIWGACVEQWATCGKQTWLCGEDVIPEGARSMSNPNTFRQPDTYQSVDSFWVDVINCSPSDLNDYCGVHTNSGVGNFWFFLLSQGGTGTNDLGNAYDVRGIGITNAARIVYLMETTGLLPSYGYNEARSVSIAAAINLFEANSCEEINVTNAWHAVGVGSRFQYSNVSISGSSTVCTSGTNFTVNNLPAGCTIKWTYSSNLQSYGIGSNYISLRAIGGGSGWVRATLNSICGQIALPQKDVFVGSPSQPFNILGFSYNGMEFGSESIYEFTVDYANNQGVNQFNWVVSGGTILSGQGTDKITVKTVKVVGEQIIYFDVSVRVGNDCGWSNYLWRSGYVTSGVGPGMFTVFPNPAKMEITVSISDEKVLSGAEMVSAGENMQVYYVRIIDMYGNMKKISKYDPAQKSVTIHVADLQKGTYLVVISNGITEESHKLFIE